MILVDFSSISLANVLAALPSLPNLDDKIIKHLIFNSLVSLRRRFHADYGELVICCDSKHSWRKDIFPFYKANRKAQRDTNVDWNLIYGTMNEVIEALHTTFPYRTVQVDGAEADDIIATLVKNCHETEEKILVISNDKDFNQFQFFYKNVDQYIPLLVNGSGRFYKTTFNEAMVNYYTHIIKGDAVDGIPNIFSDDDAIVNPDKRQNRATKDRIQSALTKAMNNEFVSDKYERNKILIDLRVVPKNIEQDIMTAYEFEGTNPEKATDRSRVWNFLVKNKLNNLMKHLTDF